MVMYWLLIIGPQLKLYLAMTEIWACADAVVETGLRAHRYTVGDRLTRA